MSDPRIIAALTALQNGKSLLITKGSDGKAHIELHDPECDPLEGCSCCDGCDTPAEPTEQAAVGVTVERNKKYVYSCSGVAVAVNADNGEIDCVTVAGNDGLIAFNGEHIQSFFAVMEKVMTEVRRTA